MVPAGKFFAYAVVVAWAGVAVSATTLLAADEPRSPCTEDAMLVFDASGSMAGNGWGYGSENPHAVSRMDKVRLALAKILPRITRMRRVGLITYGPGPYQQCNVQLDLKPATNTASRILDVVNGLIPAGQTPLSEAVEQAAEVLDCRTEPGLIVVLTDGEETCGGEPCALGKALHKEAFQLTVHVIGLRVKGLTWTGEQSVVETQCLAEKNGGLFVAVNTEQELIDALEKTLGCPMLTQVIGR
jgi:Ca-activated chloride channel homolog